MTRPGRAAWLAVVLVAAAAVEAAAQKGVDIKIHKDPKADFAAIKTYTWLPPPPIVGNVAPDAVSNPTLSTEALGPPLKAAIDRELKARGWVEAPADSADVQVAYFAALTTNIHQSFLGEHYGYITGWGSPVPAAIAPSTSFNVIERGTVVVDIVVRASKRAIWRGTATTKIHQEHTLEKRVDRINEGAARMFSQFPIKAKK